MTNTHHADLTLSSEATLLECLQQLEKAGTHIVVCVDGTRLVGVITDGDIRRALLRGRTLDSSIAGLIERNPIVVHRPYSVEKVIGLMRRRRVDAVPVIDDDRNVVDLLTLRALLRASELPTVAVIMAGGMGTRLRPMTLTTPKPLLPLNDRTIIEHIIARFSMEGIRRVVVVTNYLAEKFPDILGNGSHLGVEIEYVREPERLGTIGGLSLIPKSLITDPFIVTNGDVICLLDLRKLIAQHRDTKAAITACVKEYRQSVPFGVVRVEDGVIAELEEKPAHSFLVNAGIYCMSPEVLDRLGAGQPTDFPDLLRHMVAAGHKAVAYTIDGYWRDIGSIEDYSRAISEFREFGFATP